MEDNKVKTPLHVPTSEPPLANTCSLLLPVGSLTCLSYGAYVELPREEQHPEQHGVEAPCVRPAYPWA